MCPACRGGAKRLILPSFFHFHKPQQVHHEQPHPGEHFGVGDRHIAEVRSHCVGGEDAYRQRHHARNAGIDQIAPAFKVAAECRGQAEDGVEAGDALKERASDHDRSRTGAEKSNDLSACRDHDPGKEQRHHKGQYRTGSERFAGAHLIPCAVAVRGDRGDAGAEIHNGQHDQRVNAVCRGDGCDGVRAEAVHKILQDQAAQRADAGLQHRRQSKPHALPHNGSAEAVLSVAAFQPAVLPCSVNHNENGHRGLRQYRCRGCALYAPAKYRNEKNVQQHIDDGGKQNGQKRDPAVSESAQGRSIDIVDRQKRQSEENDTDIAAGKLDGIGWCVQQRHKRIGQRRAASRNEQKHPAEDHGEYRQHGRDIFLLLCPKVLCNQDGQPQREARDGCDKKVDGRCCHADSRQRQLAVHIADDKRIRPVVELLQDAAEDQRQAEPDQLPHDGSEFLICFHIVLLKKCRTKPRNCSAQLRG